ncbi:type VI secretion system protein IglI family protein, partial [Piscirickettsia salmonis]
KTLIWLFDTINEHVHDNKLTLSEPLDHVLSNLLAFKEALPASININVQLNKLKSYLMSAKKDKESKETQKTEDALEEEPKESISVGFKGSTKLLQLFKKIELCMELSNQNRQFEAALFYKDIQEELTNFDPITYFPEVFIPFYRNLSKSYVKIQSFIENSQDTLEWHIAEQMYKSSPEALVSGGEIYQAEELKNTHEVSDFIREHQSILPSMGVINDKSYSRISQAIIGDEEVEQEESAESTIEEQEASDDYSVVDNDRRHIQIQKESGHQGNRDRLDEIADEHAFDFEFD